MQLRSPVLQPQAVAAVSLLLLGLAGCDATEAPRARAAAGPRVERQPSWFTEITEEVGLDFRHVSAARGEYRFYEIVGAGGALFDYDGDGHLDIYLVNGTDAGSTEPARPTNRLFRQEPDGAFRDVTAVSGLGDAGYGMGCAVGDVDNDGDLDVFVTNFGADALYRNRGDGTFEDVTAAAGVGDPRWSTSACFLDYDRDGFLDLYVATYVHYDPPRSCTDNSGSREYCGPEAFRGVPDVLYRNSGDGSFTDASIEAGIGRSANKGLGVVCTDLDGDGLTDVYVANDGERNELWLNRGDGAFEDRAPVLGAALNLFGKPEASMGVAVGDVDGDLDMDLFMTHLDRETNTLYANLGSAGFEDRTAASGLGPRGLPYTGFGTALFDADHDGDLDLVVVNGRVARRAVSPNETALRRDAVASDPGLPRVLQDYAEPNLFFENDGTGRFGDACSAAGRLCSVVEVSRGLIPGDVDNDGDIDLVLTAGGGPARLFRNDLPGKGHWLRVRAIDPDLGRDALGALIEVRAGGRSYARPVISSHSYLAATDASVHFGIGDAERIEGITVVWPGGERDDFAGMAADRVVELYRGQGTGS